MTVERKMSDGERVNEGGRKEEKKKEKERWSVKVDIVMLLLW